MPRPDVHAAAARLAALSGFSVAEVFADPTRARNHALLLMRDDETVGACIDRETVLSAFVILQAPPAE